MTLDAWIASGTVVATVAMLAVGRAPPYVVMLGGLTVLMVSGVLDVKSALNGFSNSGLVTVAVLFVVAAGLRQTGTLALVVRRALGRPRTIRGAQARLAAPVIVMSGFLNNTPLVAMLLPVVQDWSRVARIPKTKVLLPLSYFAILGGVTTLIGTSTNLAADGLLIEQGYPSTGMFGITLVGIPCALSGAALLLLLGDKLLPDRDARSELREAPREYCTEVVVVPGGQLDGKQLEAAGLLHQPGLTLSEWLRGGEDLDPTNARGILQAEDRLVFVGVLESTLDVLRTPGLRPNTAQRQKLESHPADRCYAEAVVSRTSPLLAHTVKEVGFRQRYDAVVLGISRNGQRLRAPVLDADFRPGDALFLEAPRAFIDQRKNSGDFALVSRIEGEGPATSAQAPIAALILLSMVTVAGFGWLSMLEAAALAAAAMLLTRCCSEETARQSMDWPLLLAVGAAFGFGEALERTGVAGGIAKNLLALAGGDPWLSLVIVYVTTLLLTEIITNNAAAVMVLPIALSTATQLQVDYLPFAITVMVAASCGFATPIGYQTNLMVYTAGGYRFSDFLRIGIPMNVLMAIVTCTLAPILYGF